MIESRCLKKEYSTNNQRKPRLVQSEKRHQFTEAMIRLPNSSKALSSDNRLKREILTKRYTNKVIKKKSLKYKNLKNQSQLSLRNQSLKSLEMVILNDGTHSLTFDKSLSNDECCFYSYTLLVRDTSLHFDNLSYSDQQLAIDLQSLLTFPEDCYIEDISEFWSKFVKSRLNNTLELAIIVKSLL